MIGDYFACYVLDYYRILALHGLILSYPLILLILGLRHSRSRNAVKFRFRVIRLATWDCVKIVRGLYCKNIVIHIHDALIRLHCVSVNQYFITIRRTFTQDIYLRYSRVERLICLSFFQFLSIQNVKSEYPLFSVQLIK